jgi:ubiquinol-cytochrome c reductase cytochrome b subunit
VEFVLGGFTVNNATLNRFFALHFLLPFVLAALALMHLIALHDRAGSGNPLGISGNSDRLAFAPYFIFKDLITIFIFILVLSIFVFFIPNSLGDSENYVPANPLSTPASIVPEWYLLPFYAILRSIPSKICGVLCMMGSICILFALPLLDRSKIRGIQFKPLMKISFWAFIANFLLLLKIGGLHPEEPYITLGLISTIFYFSWFLLVLPLVSSIEKNLAHNPLL